MAPLLGGLLVVIDPDDRKLVRVDLWVGGKMKLSELRLPAEAEVLSGGEIEKFVDDRIGQALS